MSPARPLFSVPKFTPPRPAVGTFVVYGNTGAEGYRWRHWGCVTSRQLDNMHGSSLYKVPADISGFDQLRPEDQLRVEDAFYAREGECRPSPPLSTTAHESTVNAADIPATALAGKKTLAAQRDDAIYHPVPATPPSMGIGSVPSTPQSPEKSRVPATPAYKARGKKNRREVDEDDLGSNVHRSFGVAVRCSYACGPLMDAGGELSQVLPSRCSQCQGQARRGGSV